MTVRNYIDNSPSTGVLSALTSTATLVGIRSVAGFPVTFPYVATIDLGTASAEVVLVTAATGTTLTVVRNFNGQGAFSHPAAVSFDHTAVALDYRESNTHINASSGVHGVSGAVVGTSDTQTLSNKTLVAPVITGNIALAGGYLTDNATATSVVTGSTGSVLAVAQGPFTLAATRRVKVTVSAHITQNSNVNSRYTIKAGVCAAGTVTVAGFTPAGPARNIVSTSSTAAGAVDPTAIGTVLLAAGSWVACALIATAGGGNAADTVANGYVLAEDLGPN